MQSKVRTTTSSVLQGLALASLILLGGCGPAEETTVSVTPVPFHDSDECHVCGMIVMDFPGPKGQAIQGGQARKFCSVAEMLGWWLQPENQSQNATLFVHDMAESEWAAPDDTRMIDARKAYFVPVPQLPGAMGEPLATYADPVVAQAMADRYDSQVLRLEQIDLARLQRADSSHGHGHADHDAHAQGGHSHGH